jgi:endonuclease III
MTPLIFSLLQKHYGKTEYYLRWKTPEELLVATILSAQCTDERVNIVTRGLFKKYKNPQAFAETNLPQLEQDIRSTGFFRNKAKAIKKSNELLVDKYHGKLPHAMGDLLTLPGVARKTANALQQNAFGIVEGIVVDTHVIRLSNRFGWSETKNAVIVEKDLMRIIARPHWGSVPGLMKAHGKAVCKAPQPNCDDCFLKKKCPSAFNFSKYRK